MPVELSASVIIPTYGRPKSLPNCLASLEQQTVLPKEVIVVVDGGITPEVQAVIDDFIGHNKLTIIQINNTAQMGAQVSRSKGLAKATGDIVTYLDDDITMEPDWLAQLLSCYTSESVAGAGGIVIDPTPFIDNIVYKTFKKTRRFLMHGLMGKLNFIGLPWEYLIYPSEKNVSVDFINSGNASFRRDVLLTHGPDAVMDLDYVEELNLGAVLTRCEGRTIIYNSHAVAYHNHERSGGSWTNNRMYLTIRDHTSHLVKNFRFGYVRLGCYYVYVLGLAIIFRQTGYFKAIREGLKQYNYWRLHKRDAPAAD